MVLDYFIAAALHCFKLCIIMFLIMYKDSPCMQDGQTASQKGMKDKDVEVPMADKTVVCSTPDGEMKTRLFIHQIFFYMEYFMHG